MKTLSPVDIAYYKMQIWNKIDAIERDLKSKKRVTAETIANTDRVMQLTTKLFESPKNTGVIDYQYLIENLTI